ncbi:MAG: ATP-binding protein [Alphaproteobacteria bacterium]|nr:ATP-binding protein [Alphaproteobacteria bacterium]
MYDEKNEIIAALGHFNPWWRGVAIPDLSTWKRAAFHELLTWVTTPPAPRAIMLSGARQVGKTTLILQTIEELLKRGIPAANIIYVTLDHPLLKIHGIQKILEAWREREPKKEGDEYLFIDEAQFITDWGTWVKHQVDFEKRRHVIMTGSAMPLMRTDQESGVGRWHTIKLTTLSFYEYIQLKKINLEPLPKVESLRELFSWTPADFYKTTQQGASYLGHFNEYLVRGGFPQTAQVESIDQAQRLLREDIIDRSLKRDMTALFGVRRILDLERLFLYLCMHDGGALDMTMLCNNLKINRPSVENFLELLESAHLIYRLPPYGYGKEILRARYKVYLADSAIAPAVLLKGNQILDNPLAMSVSAESTVLKHLHTRYYSQNARLTYWHGKKKQEIDLVADLSGHLIPFEVKYQSQITTQRDIKGLIELCSEKEIKHAYVITKSMDDIGPLPLKQEIATKIVKIPAALLCFWIGENEARQNSHTDYR